MIWHILEIWLLFVVVFAIGCWLGVLLHTSLAVGPLAAAQEALADTIGNVIDRAKWRLGFSPDWRPEARHTVEWPEHNPAPEPNLAAADAPSEEEVDNTAFADDAESLRDDWAEEADLEDAADVDEAEQVLRDEELDTALEGQFDEMEEPEADFTEELDVMRPAALAAPRTGVPDNLQRIWGIGKRNEELLHSLGIFHFGQIAAWTPAEARWVANHLVFPERLERDNWIGQATVLATGGDPGSVSRSNEVTSQSPDEPES